MKKLTYFLAISMLGLASVMNASASQDVSMLTPGLATAPAAHVLKTSYVAPALGQTSQASLGASVGDAAKTAADEKSLVNELPQNGALTLLAGLAIIVVIGKRRMSR
jgi:hypothetical protein